MVQLRVNASQNFNAFLRDYRRFTDEGFPEATERYVNDLGLSSRFNIQRWGRRDLVVGNRQAPRLLTVGKGNRGNTRNVRYQSTKVRQGRGRGRLFINNKPTLSGRSQQGGQRRYSVANVLIDSIPGQGLNERIGSGQPRQSLWIPKGGFSRAQVSAALRKSLRAQPSEIQRSRRTRNKTPSGGKTGSKGFLAFVIYDSPNGLTLVRCRITRKPDEVRSRRLYPHRVGGPGEIMAFMPRRANWSPRRGKWGGRFRWQLYARDIARQAQTEDRSGRIIADRVRHIFRRNYNFDRRRGPI